MENTIGNELELKRSRMGNEMRRKQKINLRFYEK